MAFRILLADDHLEVREAVAALLSAVADFVVVAVTADALSTLAAACALDPDIVVQDVNMPGMSGVVLARRIVEAAPRARVIALSLHGDAMIVSAMLGAGARGYVLKDDVHADLEKAIREVAAGRCFTSAGISISEATAQQPTDVAGRSRREH